MKPLMRAVNPTVVVEPQEYDAYAEEGWTTAVLPANDQGLAFSRQWVLDEARRKGLGWIWVLDDDITGFFEVVSGRCQPVDANVALAGAESIILAGDPHAAHAALEYQQFAWRARQPAVLAGYCDVAMAVDVSRVNAYYREDASVKLDRDFTLQVMASGWPVLRVTRFAFACPSIGSNAGGLDAVYREPDEEARAVQRMCDWWPGVCTPKRKPNGRADVRINWKAMRA